MRNKQTKKTNKMKNETNKFDKTKMIKNKSKLIEDTIEYIKKLEKLDAPKGLLDLANKDLKYFRSL